MTDKDKISKFLQEWNGGEFFIQDVYIEKECADLMAEGIVELLSTDLVVGSDEWKADLHKETQEIKNPKHTKQIRL